MRTKKRRPVVSRTKKKTTRVTIAFSTTQHRKLKATAARRGISLQEYIRSRLSRDSEEVDASDSELKPIVKRIPEPQMSDTLLAAA